MLSLTIQANNHISIVIKFQFFVIKKLTHINTHLWYLCTIGSTSLIEVQVSNIYLQDTSISKTMNDVYVANYVAGIHQGFSYLLNIYAIILMAIIFRGWKLSILWFNYLCLPHEMSMM